MMDVWHWLLAGFAMFCWIGWGVTLMTWSMDRLTFVGHRCDPADPPAGQDAGAR